MLKQERDGFVNLGLGYYGDRDPGKHSCINRPYFIKGCFLSAELLSGNGFR